MKKLMIALSAAAAAIFAFGDLSPHGAGFEAGYAGGAFDSQLADDGESTSGDRYWYSTSNDGNVISNYADGISIASTKVPDFFNGDYGSKYLFLDTSAPLFRTVNPNSHNPEFTAESIGEGIYLDTLVKFSAADSAFDKDLTDGDKIAIEYVECDTENDPNGVGYTNFVVRAGYIGSELVVQTNYFVEVPASFNKDDWHRLTVRAISGIDGDGHVGFAVYLNGTALTYGEGVTIGDSFVAAPGVIADLHGERALFPSAVQSGDDKNTISAASFSGTGAIDDVVFTSVKPEFINEATTVTIRWDTTAVASISIAGAAVTGEDFAAGTATVPLVGATIEVIATAAQGYDLVFTPPENGGWNSSTSLFTGLVANDVCAVTGFIPLFDVGGAHYGTIQDAVDAAQAAGTTAESPATLKLLADVDGMIQLSSGYVVIDLAGKTIEDTDCAIYNAGANLLITNSTAAIGHVVGALAVAIEQAPTVIAGGSIDGVVDGAGDVQDVVYLTITGGLFLDGDYDPVDNPAFYLADFVVAGQTPVLTEIGGDNYFQVGEPPTPPTTYELSIPVVANASATVTAGGVQVADLTAIAENTEVVVTWAAAEGYKITAGGTETITMTENKTAASPTVEAITYATLTITQVANCTIVVSNATEEVATGAKFDVDDAVVLTVYRTPAEGYELDNCAATDTVTMDQDRTVTAAVKQAAAATWTVTLTLGANVSSVSYCLTDDLATTNMLNASGSFTIEKNKSFVFVGVVCAEGYELDVETSMASIQGATIDSTTYFITPTADASGTISAKSSGDVYPTYIPDDADAKAKYNAWKALYGADANSEYEDAFLLNCAPADVDTEKAAFKLNITVVGDTVTVTTPDGKTYNGTVQLKGSNDLSTWTDVESASKTYQFYKAVLSL